MATSESSKNRKSVETVLNANNGIIMPDCDNVSLYSQQKENCLPETPGILPSVSSRLRLTGFSREKMRRRHKDCFCDFVQLQHLSGHLDRIMKQSESFEKTLAEKRTQLESTRQQFGEFLQKIHNTENLRKAQALKEDFSMEKAMTLRDFNQQKGILEKEIGEIQSQVYSTGMNKQFVIDVKNEMSAGEELSLREFIESPRYGVKAVMEILENFEFRQVSEINMFAETEADCQNWETSMKEEITSMEEQRDLYRKNAKKDKKSYSEWSERANFTKKYLSNILNVNNFRCDNIMYEVNILTARIFKMFKQLLPDEDVEDTTTMQMLEKIENRVFFILDLIQDCPKKTTEVELKKQFELRAKEARTKQVELAKQERHKKCARRLQKILDPRPPRILTKKPTYMTRLPRMESGESYRTRLKQKEEIEIYGMTMDTCSQSSAKRASSTSSASKGSKTSKPFKTEKTKHIPSLPRMLTMDSDLQHRLEQVCRKNKINSIARQNQFL